MGYQQQSVLSNHIAAGAYIRIAALVAGRERQRVLCNVPCSLIIFIIIFFPLSTARDT